MRMRQPFKVARPIVVFLCFSPTFDAAILAHTVEQQLNAYEDSEGLNRQRMNVNLGLLFSHPGSINETSYNLDVRRDIVRDNNLIGNDYSQDVYEGGDQVQDAVTLSASQTWEKLTSTRILASASMDEQVRSRTYGAGLSRWVAHESLQLSFDLSRTVVDRPKFEVLGVDSDIESPPTIVNAVGTTLGIKHLATTTTVMDYTVMHAETNDRPPANTYGVGVKQFIPITTSAVHANVARAVNRGRVTNESNYGEVSAWLGEVAFLQYFKSKTSAKFSYRYYQEDEVTRIEKDELTRGSDAIALNFAQEIPKGTVDSLQVPVVLHIGASRYLTNAIDASGTKVAANTIEAGVQAKF